MTARRILITGASGFTGRYVLQSLKRAGLEPLVLNSNLCDDISLIAEIASIKPEAAIHLAGIAYVGHGNHADFYRVNVIGTLNLLQALEATHSIIDPVVLASSANVYGNSYQDEAIQESFKPNLINDYAVSKLAMEKMASLWKDRLPITIVRPFNYTGIGQPPSYVVPKIIDTFSHRKPEISLGNVSVWRDFSDVRDISRWDTEIIKKNIVNHTINFCSGKIVSLKEIIHICEQIVKYKIKLNIDTKLQRRNELIQLQGDRTLLQSLLGPKSNQIYTIKDTINLMLCNKVSDINKTI